MDARLVASRLADVGSTPARESRWADPGPRGAARFLGASLPASRVRDDVRRLAGAPTSVLLIRGESGTGKGLVARALHEEGPHPTEPFLGVLCSALPETLLEAELFGHEAGAFTDARHPKPGLFEVVGTGTLLLDEVGDMSPGLQARLLGVLEERTFRRVGGVVERPFRGRLLAATHRDLDALAGEGRLRRDLLYRLRVVPLDLPPLRLRPADVPLLARHFLGALAARLPPPSPEISDEALALLARRPWPGNVRELRAVVERMVVTRRRDRLGVEDVLEEYGAPAVATPGWALPPGGLDLERLIDDLLREASLRTGGNLSATARLLHWSRDRVRRRLARRAR